LGNYFFHHLQKEEESVCVNERMVVKVLQKNAKLKKKLMERRKMSQIKMWFFLVSWVFIVMFCVLFVMKINCKWYLLRGQCLMNVMKYCVLLKSVVTSLCGVSFSIISLFV